MRRARSSNLWGRITILSIICCLATVAQGKYSGGSGTETEPYRIGTIADWQELMESAPDWDKHFVLIAGLDMNGVTASPVGNDANNFTGVFDGNDHVIRNVDMNMPGSDEVGVFGYVGHGAQIRNIGVESVVAAGNENIGALVGRNVASIINCYAIGRVRGDSASGGQVLKVGGLVGWNNGIISNCYATGSAVGNGGHVGGLAGSNYGGNISDCYSTGDVSGWRSVGGLVGFNLAGISNCYATGSVSGDGVLGGLVGKNYGSITDCCSTGSVSGLGDVGGSVGFNDRASVSNCYATGPVTGDGCVGALVGRSSDGTISNCYSTGPVTGVRFVGGLVGRSRDDIIINCYSTGDVSGTGDDAEDVGGLVGKNHCGTITNSYATGSVTGNNDRVGGLVGFNDRASVSNCYATGPVTGDGCVGGLVGNNEGGSFSDCYSTGTVSGSSLVGGLVGNNDGGRISDCYSTGSASGDTDVGGLVGRWLCRGVCIIGAYFLDPNDGGGPDNGCGIPLTDTQMRQQGSFIDWDFIEVWNIGENQTYPYLRTVAAGDINKDRIVNFLDLCIIADQWMKEE